MSTNEETFQICALPLLEKVKEGYNAILSNQVIYYVGFVPVCVNFEFFLNYGFGFVSGQEFTFLF